MTTEFPSIVLTNSNKPLKKKLKIAVIGFGNFGQFIAKTFVKDHIVYGVAQSDQSAAAKGIGQMIACCIACVLFMITLDNFFYFIIGCEFYPLFELTSLLKLDLDVILLSVSIISFENVLKSLPKELLNGKLIVDVLSVKVDRR